MDTHRLFIIGDSLFAETLKGILAKNPSVTLLGSAPHPADALTQLQAVQPDAVIMAGANEFSGADLGALLAAHPALPIIRADLNSDTIQIITSHLIGTRPTDLLTALEELPQRKGLQRASEGLRGLEKAEEGGEDRMGAPSAPSLPS